MADARRPTLPSLTGLRFVAALLVVLFHVNQLFAAPWLDVAKLGYVGVSFFFVLSGFVLTWSGAALVGRARFYWHRFARIWPLHALTTLLVLGAGLAAGSAAVVWRDLALLQAWDSRGIAAPPVVSPSWSLSTEAFFYLVFPGVLVLVARLRRLLAPALAIHAAVLVIALVAVAADPGMSEVLYWLPPYRLGEFLIGVIAAEAMIRGWRPPVPARGAVVMLAVAYLGTWAAGLEDDRLLVAWLLLPATALLITTMAHRDLERRGRGLAGAWGTRLGAWSFALYLIHVPVLQALKEAGAAPVVALVLGLALSVGASALLYTAFERPVERRLRRAAAPRAGGALVPAGQHSR